MENTVLQKFREGRPSLGTFTALNNPLAVESLRYTGLDYVIVDTEHSPVGIESAAAQIAAAQGAGLTALARANEISRTAVLRLLDVGAQGVVVPCVETVDEVRELIQYAKFAPLGNRGFCPTRDGRLGSRRPRRPHPRLYGGLQPGDAAAAPVRDRGLPGAHRGDHRHGRRGRHLRGPL